MPALARSVSTRGVQKQVGIVVITVGVKCDKTLGNVLDKLNQSPELKLEGASRLCFEMGCGIFWLMAARHM